jgi:hypothetical protein
VDWVRQVFEENACPVSLVLMNVLIQAS